MIAFRQIRQNPAEFCASVDMQIPHRRLTVFVARPLLYSDERFYLRYMGEIIADAAVPITASRGRYLNDDLGVHMWQAPVSSILIPVYSRAKTAVYESLAETRISRIALQLGTYERRNGEYPDGLGQLNVPDAAMITDPFSGKAFIYKRQGKGFILYSVGPDMKDDGGRKVSTGHPEPGTLGDIVVEGKR